MQARVTPTDFAKAAGRVLVMASQRDSCMTGNLTLPGRTVKSDKRYLTLDDLPRAGDNPRMRTLRQLLKERGLTVAELARRVRVSRPGASAWVNGKSEPTPQNIQEIADVLNVHFEDIKAALARTRAVAGEIDSSSDSRLVTKQQPAQDTASGGIRGAFRDVGMFATATFPRDVPLLGTAMGGKDGELFIDRRGEPVDYVRRPPGLSKSADVFAIIVQGDSMWPRYRDGEMLYISTRRAVSPDDHVIIRLHGDSDDDEVWLLKHLIRRTADTVELEQYNPMKRISLPRDRISAMHKILDMSEVLGV